MPHVHHGVLRDGAGLVDIRGRFLFGSEDRPAPLWIASNCRSLPSSSRQFPSNRRPLPSDSRSVTVLLTQQPLSSPSVVFIADQLNAFQCRWMMARQ